MRVLPADVYDTLEFSALVFGGIGAGAVYDYEVADQNIPYCVLGHAIAATDDRRAEQIMGPLRRAEIDVLQNDAAVEAVNARKGARSPSWARISFSEWRAQLGVVRGN